MTQPKRRQKLGECSWYHESEKGIEVFVRVADVGTGSGMTLSTHIPWWRIKRSVGRREADRAARAANQEG